MRIIIAPAKKMTVDTDSFAVDGLPQFLGRVERLKTVLQGVQQDGGGLSAQNCPVCHLCLRRVKRR